METDVHSRFSSSIIVLVLINTMLSCE